VVSLSSDEELANERSYSPAVSADGRYVVFASHATNLSPLDTYNGVDVFVRDRQLGTTELASRISDEEHGMTASDHPAINSDGAYVVFDASSSELPEDHNGAQDVFVRTMD